MGLCGALCRCCGTLFLLGFLVCCLPLIPQLEVAMNWVRLQKIDNGWLYLAITVPVYVGGLLKCTPAFVLEGQISWLTCFKEGRTFDYPMTMGWEAGASVFYNMERNVAAFAYSHEAYKTVSYDPSAKRTSKYLSQCDITSTLPGGVDRLLVNLDTGSADWVARRNLMLDALPALHLDGTGHGLPAIVPPGISKQNGGSKKAVNAVVGTTLFRWLFDIDVTDTLDKMFEYDEIIGPCIVTQQPPSASGVEKMTATRNGIFKKIAASQVGKDFMAIAEERGMDGKIRLHDVVWTVLFAGYGGTSNLAHNVLAHILKDKDKQIALFRADPHAYMLEATRKFPAVAGMNPWTVQEGRDGLIGGKVKLPDGSTYQVKPGTPSFIITTGANNDPSVFENPLEFRVGRGNVERQLTFNAEIQDVRKCPNSTTAGCPAAPRPCPGMWLAIRVAKAAVTFFTDSYDVGASKKHGEL
eukprot:TRINITY_DN75159_c0_g1_i1.p1 TRINITY_DN75159_c0_g1~~TRINITY_DN75159_c0_g1_i1.p1  ORF type:complete len:468 (-),score=73.43 TRINITY_DN75159_c0_g1_i1:61-1464(-)